MSRRLLVPLLAVALGACGGGSTTASTTPSLNGIQNKLPQQALKASRDALTSVKSVHLDADFTDDKGAINFAADVDLDHRVAHLLGTERGGHFETVVSGARVYLNGDGTFFKAIGQDSLGQLFSGRWVLPPTSSPLATGLLALVDRINFPDCVLAPTHGTLRVGGLGNVGGVTALAVNDAGDAPGSAPSSVSISAVSTPFPVRIQQTGGTRSGGPSAPPCSLAGSSVTKGTVALSQFNAAVAISVPSNAVDLSLLGGGPTP